MVSTMSTQISRRLKTASLTNEPTIEELRKTPIKCHCGALCGAAWKGGCEGEIVAVDDEYEEDEDGGMWYWVHRCEKHAEEYDG